MSCILLFGISVCTCVLLNPVKARRFNINKLSDNPNDGFIPQHFHYYIHWSNGICQTDYYDKVGKWLSGCCHSSVILIAFICHYYSLLMDDSCLQAVFLLPYLIEFEPMFFLFQCKLQLECCFLVSPWKPLLPFDYLMLFVSGFEQAS